MCTKRVGGPLRNSSVQAHGWHPTKLGVHAHGWHPTNSMHQAVRVSLQTPKVVDHGAANSACDQSCGEQVGENNKWLSSISTAHFIPKNKSF